MEKLIELLLECKPQIHYLDKPKGIYDKKYGYGIGWYKREWDIGWWFSEEVIISKKFWFIKWLVDKDKIDIEKVIDTAKSSVIDTYYYEEGIDDIYIPLLMVLAVEDEPIEFLISILK